jgi:hypothetical protein
MPLAFIEWPALCPPYNRRISTGRMKRGERGGDRNLPAYRTIQSIETDRPTYSGAGADLSMGAKNICQLTLTLIPPLGSEDNGGHGRLQQKREKLLAESKGTAVILLW